MAVTATPAASPRTPTCDLPGVTANPTPVDCAAKFILTPKQGTARGQPVLSRTQSVALKGGQVTSVDWIMRDQDGSPINMTTCDCLPDSSSSETAGSASSVAAECTRAVKFRMTEHLCLTAGGGGRVHYAAVCETIDAETGHYRIPITKVATSRPGVYFGQVALVEIDADGDEVILFANTFYLYVERSAWSQRHTPKGPPTIAEIRLHLRDSGPNENYLLDNIRFDDAEIAHAAVLPVEQWNELPPPVGVYSTSTFPFRYHWLHAICGHLFLMVAEQFRANNLKYSAAGVQIDDQDKEVNYERAAQMRLGIWNDFIRKKKAEINLSQCWGGIGSPYGGYG